MSFAKEAEVYLEKFVGKRLLVIGDIMLDEFVWGKVTRISPEAPVPVVDVHNEERFAGGAANVARNLRALDADVRVIGRVGRDEQAPKLLGLLNCGGVDTSLVLHSSSVPTIVKTRIIASDLPAHVGQEFAGMGSGPKVVERPHQIVRVDREKRAKLSPEDFAAFSQSLPGAVDWAEAVIVEDYGKGMVNQPVVDAVRSACERAGKFWTVDPNPNNPLLWTGTHTAKPNRSEAFASAGLALSDEPEAMDKVGSILLDKWGAQMLLITLGAQGMQLFRRDHPAYHSPTKAIEVFDVSGAGDTTIAAYTLAIAAGADPVSAVEIANHAAGVVVAKIGTATVSRAELKEALDRE